MPEFLSFLGPLGAFVALVIGFCFLIFVHELGHFLAAKAVGMKVTQFAIGMGPAICSWRKGIGLRLGSTEGEYQKKLDETAMPATIADTKLDRQILPLQIRQTAC